MDTFECVLAMAEYRNMTKAADHLFLTQPALTLRIQRLEKELGFQIFDRSTRPISITPGGQAYIQGMIRIRNEEEKLKYKLNEIKYRSRNTVRIGIGFNRGTYWLPTLIPYLMKEYPNTDYQFQEATDQEIEKLLKSGDLDYGSTGSFLVMDDLASLEISKENIYICIPPLNPIFENVDDLSQYSFENPYVLNIQMLNGQTFIMGRSSYGITRYMNMLFAMNHITPGKIISIGNSETSYQLACQGVGIAFKISHYYFSSKRELASSPVPCVLRDIPLQRTSFLLCRQMRMEDTETKELLKTLQNLFL